MRLSPEYFVSTERGYRWRIDSGAGVRFVRCINPKLALAAITLDLRERVEPPLDRWDLC
jgi:hypothetical protein